MTDRALVEQTVDLLDDLWDNEDSLTYLAIEYEARWSWKVLWWQNHFFVSVGITPTCFEEVKSRLDKVSKLFHANIRFAPVELGVALSELLRTNVRFAPVELKAALSEKKG